MRKAKALAALLLTAMTAVMLSGCLYISIGNNGKTVTGSGKMGTLDVPMENELLGVDNQSSIDVVIDPSLSGKAVIEGDGNLTGYVKLEQDSAGTLYVDYETGVNIVRLSRMTVRIPAVKGGRIAVNGSGGISQAGGTLAGDSFDVRINGSGDISLNLETPSLYVDVNASGDAVIGAQSDEVFVNSDASGSVSLSGAAKTLSISSTGSGDVDGFDFAAQDAEVSLHGSGDAHVTVTGALTGEIAGSGDIVCGGSPVSVDVNDNGSGDVLRR